uniref:Uncharacterized protein n=1 Tax=Anopheles dirus TaxID=7168 RepID=A0A182NW64_9DIPT
MNERMPRTSADFLAVDPRPNSDETASCLVMRIRGVEVPVSPCVCCVRLCLYAVSGLAGADRVKHPYLRCRSSMNQNIKCQPS